MSQRIRSIDLLRGAVMVLMAIDHVRVYSGVPAGGTTPAVFFTRWITHFCVPAFVFFAGTSAFLYGSRQTGRHVLSRYLLKRGLLLVLLELTVIRFSWTFNIDYAQFTLAGVIWMLGWCMVIMAALVRLRPVTVGITGLVILFGQHAFHYAPLLLPLAARQYFGWFWEFIYPANLDKMPGIAILYVLVPWIGVMAAGYGFGKILLLEPARRNRICIRMGLAMVIVFLITGSIMILMQSPGPGSLPFLFRLLNQNKYPASSLYLLMTLGPVIALIPFAEKAKGWLSGVCTTFGKVPLFYYLLHIPVIHTSALIVNKIMKGAAFQEWYASAPFTSVPPEQRWGLGLLYLVFIIDVTLLYFACRWYAGYRAAHPHKKWLKYI